MTSPPWADAKPLPGCEVIRPGATPAPARPPPKTPGSVAKKLATVNRFLDRSARRLPPPAVVVWVLLWRDERGGTARTAVSDLAARSGLSPRTVKRQLRLLRDRGLIESDHRGTPTTGPTVYRLRAVGSGGVTGGP